MPSHETTDNTLLSTLNSDKDYAKSIDDGAASPSADNISQNRPSPIGEPVKKIASINDVGAIPDGGLTAWLQVLGAFFLFFNSWGIVNTFGVFQTYYETQLLVGTSPSAISWIGSIQAFLLMMFGSLTGPIYDAGYFRTLVISGTFLISFGMMMTSISTEFYQVLLAQAFCVGLGCGCLFVPSVAILSTYFTSHIALAMGLAASGSSLGGVIYPIMWHRLQPMIGFGWATRVFGFVVFATLLIPLAVMRVRVLPSKGRKLIDPSAFRHPPYSIFTMGTFVGFTGLYAPFFYVQLYSIAKSITSPALVFYLLPIINAASIFGRIIPNFFADRLGPLNVMIPCAMISGLLTICLIPMSTTAALVVFCVLYGFFSGTFVSLPPAVLVSLSPNRGMIGTHMGMAFSITSVGVLIGTPICGAILDRSGFSSVWVFGGVLPIAGGFILAASRLAKTGLVLVQRA